MRLHYRLFPLFALLLTFGLNAQNCQYQLRMEDDLGDGWNGGELTIRVAGVATTYTLEDGDAQSVFFSVSDGDAIEVDYNPGAFPEETSFSIFNNADSLLFTSGPPPAAGTNIFVATAACDVCVAPALNSINIFRVRSTTADIRFNSASAGTNPLYLIEYGLGDYDPTTDAAEGNITSQDTALRVRNLESDMPYTFWISTICQTENDTTSRRGPFPIMTQKRADVGITELASPLTGCNLGLEEVTIGITNFGGEAQAFFNVDFTINDLGSTISRPDDGIFTGVVGVDSTEFFTFDAMAFLDGPGAYEFTVWTELEGDEDSSNDTMRFTVVHVPQITDYPYAENFEQNDGFWYSERGGRGISSWRWGAPFAPFIDRAPNGENAWVTNLGGDYNDRELSYLVSPCFDLSEMADDPLFSAILRVRTEVNFDGVWLEMTKDEGANWEKVVNSPAATSWYNDLVDQQWEGDGGFGDAAQLVSNLLPGAAGDTIQLRFVFESSRSGTMEGVLVDNVSISERAENNLAAISVVVEKDCEIFSSYKIDFEFANVGTATASGFTLNYLIDGTVFSEMFDGELLPGRQASIQFTQTDQTDGLDVPIPFWVSLPDDIQINNDTTFVMFENQLEVPFYERFTNGRFPNSWRSETRDFQVSASPDDDSQALITSLTASGISTFTTGSYGELEETDSLRFDVSLNDLADPEQRMGHAKLRVLTDGCDFTGPLLEIDSLVSGTYTVAAGFGKFLFEVEWVAGEFTVAFDNINITRCPDNLGLIAEYVGVSAPGETDAVASITPTQGLAPFTFVWSTGDATQQVDGLPEGDVFVAVTDVAGCMDTVFFTVDLSTDTEDPLQLLAGMSVAPNPTANAVALRLELPEARLLQASVFDLSGRRLLFRDFGRQRQLNERIDFGAFPAGVYLLRLQAGEVARTVRVVRR